MKYLDLELEGQLSLSKKVYENVDFDKSLLRTEINLGYVGAGKKEGIGLGDAIRILEDSSRYINHGKSTLSVKVDVDTYTRTYYKAIRDEDDVPVSSIKLVSFNYVTGESINVPDTTRTKNVADTYLNGVMPKRYGRKSDGSMKKHRWAWSCMRMKWVVATLSLTLTVQMM